MAKKPKQPFNANATKRLADLKEEQARRVFLTQISAGSLQGVKDICAEYADALTFAALEPQIHSGCTALHFAAMAGHKPVIDFMLEAGADLHLRDDAGDTAAHTAVLMGKQRTALQLIEKGITPDALLLHYAAYHGHEKVVKKALEAGVSANAVDNRGISPLMSACMGYGGKRDAVTAALLAHGADPLYEHPTHGTALGMTEGTKNEKAAGVLTPAVRTAQVSVAVKNCTVAKDAFTVRRGTLQLKKPQG